MIRLVAQQRLIARPIARSVCRTFSTTFIRRNDQQNAFSPDQLNKIQNSEAFQKLTNDPLLMEKFQDIATYLQKNEFVQPGQPPSVFQVAKILTNREARDKLVAFTDAAKSAGVDFKSEEFTEMIKMMGKK